MVLVSKRGILVRAGKNISLTTLNPVRTGKNA
jgi:hypothetical protein